MWWIHDFPQDIQDEYFPGTEHMDKAYHQKRYHFIRALWGMLIGLIPSVLGAAIHALIV